MPATVLVALVAAAAVVALRGPLKAAFAVVVAAFLLTPGTLSVPGVSHEATISRLVLYAFALGLALRWTRGELAPGAFRFSRVHVALLVFVAVALVNGVALAEAPLPLNASLSQWLRIVDQLVLLVSATAAIRSLDRRWVVTLLAALMTVVAAIAILEHVTGGSWGHWLFSRLPAQHDRPGSFPLDARGNELRARGAAQFALEFGWVGAILTPLVVAATATARRRVALLAPVAVVIAVVFSWSRSSLLGLVLGAGLVLLLCGGHRRLSAVILAGLAVAILVATLAPGLRQPFEAAKQSDAIAVRERRLPAVLDIAAERPVTGLGLGGLAFRGFETTDVSYVLVYAQLGVIGLAAFVVAVAAAIGTALAGLRARDPAARAVAAAVGAGLLLVPIAAGAYDLSSVTQSTAVLWMLAAVAVVFAEAAPHAERRAVAWRPGRLALPVAGALAGLAVAALAPTHAAITYRFTTLPDSRLARSASDSQWAGRVLIASACAVVDGMHLPARAVVECRERTFTVGLPPPGMAELRVQTGSVAEARAIGAVIVAGVRHALPATEFEQVGPVRTGRATAARTAPAWLPWTAFLLAVLVPPLPRRPRRTRLPARLAPAPA